MQDMMLTAIIHEIMGMKVIGRQIIDGPERWILQEDREIFGSDEISILSLPEILRDLARHIEDAGI